MIQHSYENAEGARVPFPQFESPMHFFGIQDVTFESNVDGGFVEEHKSKEMLLPRQDFDTQHQVSVYDVCVCVRACVYVYVYLSLSVSLCLSLCSRTCFFFGCCSLTLSVSASVRC